MVEMRGWALRAAPSIRTGASPHLAHLCIPKYTENPRDAPLIRGFGEYALYRTGRELLLRIVAMLVQIVRRTGETGSGTGSGTGAGTN